MINEHDCISLFGYPLFTIVNIDTPFNGSLDIPADACYAYVIQGDRQVFSKSDNIAAIPGHTILSLCGITLGHMLAQQPEGGIHSVIVHFNRDVLNKVFKNEKPLLWEELKQPVTKYVDQSAANGLVENYFDSVRQMFQYKEAITESILQLKLKEVILLLLKADNSDNVLQIVRSLFSEKEFSFKELVDAHIENANSIEELAMATNCSLSVFKKKFKEAYNTTPAKYRLQLKIEKVAELLRTSDEPVNAIGYECGFNSPEHLSRVFKDRYGYTPREYRQRKLIK